jgi:hypothetical protein
MLSPQQQADRNAARRRAAHQQTLTNLRAELVQVEARITRSLAARARGDHVLAASLPAFYAERDRLAAEIRNYSELHNL